MKPASAPAPSWDIRRLKSPRDGISIRYAVREGTDPSRVVFFLNGRSEFIEKYQDLPDDTRFGDLTWVMMDHRGQGASEGLRSHVESYDDFAEDARAVIEAAGKGRAYILIAHSMGGLISLYGTMTGRLKPVAMVLCSPLFGILAPMPMGFAKALARTLSRTFLAERNTGSKVDRRAAFPGNILTHSEARFNAMADSPYRTSSPTFGWVHATFEAFAVIFDKERLKALTTPVSLMVGDQEKVVDRTAYAGWMQTREELNGSQTRFKLIPGANHELLNESDTFRKQALAFVDAAIAASTP